MCDDNAGCDTVAGEGAGNQFIGRIILVAGPSCAGKSALIERLRSGQLTRLKERLQMGDPDNWTYKDAWQMKNFSVSGLTNLVLHYDILRLMDKNIRSYDFDPVFDLVRSARHVVMLSLLENPDILLQRCLQRRRKVFKYLKKWRFLTFFERLKPLNRKCRLYRNPETLAQWFDRWFDFCSTLGCSNHFVVHSLNPEESLEQADMLAIK
jgi:hypothetical protein